MILLKNVLSNIRKIFKKLPYIKSFLLYSRRNIMSKIRYGKGFTPRKTGEPLQGTELQEREKDKDEK